MVCTSVFQKSVLKPTELWKNHTADMNGEDTLPVLQYLRNYCLKNINRLYSRAAPQLPRPRRKQPVYAEFILATGWYFSNTRL